MSALSAGCAVKPADIASFIVAGEQRFIDHLGDLSRDVVPACCGSLTLLPFLSERGAGLETVSPREKEAVPEEFRKGMADGLLFCRTEEQEPALRWELTVPHSGVLQPPLLGWNAQGSRFVPARYRWGAPFV
jgi:hypothetical protein